MALHIGSTVINTTDIARSTEFWTQALGYQAHGDDTFVVLKDPNRNWSNLSLQLTDEPKSGVNRLHLDLYTRDQAEEVTRLEVLGATRIAWDYPDDPDFVVMEDPDGNEFCVVQTHQSRG